MTQSLYKITDRYLIALENLCIDQDFDQETIEATLESLQGEFEEKAKAIGAYILNLQASAKARREAVAKIQAMATTEEHKADWLKQYLLDCMHTANIKKVDGVEWQAKIRKSPHRVVVDDISALPTDFLIREVKTSVSKTDLRMALKDGHVEGAHLEQHDYLSLK